MFVKLVDSIPTKLLHPEAASFRPELFSPARLQDTAIDMDAESDQDPDNSIAGQTSVLGGLNQPSPINYSVFQTKISFLAQYRDFHAFFAQGDRQQAAAQLVHLIKSGVCPRRFVAVLLLDTIPLLEGENSMILLKASSY